MSDKKNLIQPFKARAGADEGINSLDKIEVSPLEGKREGWVKLYRQLLESAWMRNHKLIIFWIYCLLKATHKPFKATVELREVSLQPGQFIFGRKKASKETGLSEREIRSRLKFLQGRGSLTIKKTNKFSIITIVNWAKYQGSQPLSDHQEDQQATSKRPHTRSKEKEKDQIRSAPGPQWLEFLSFWEQSFRKKYGFPYAGDKEKDRKRIKKILLKGYSPDQLHEAARSFFESPDPEIQKSEYRIKDFRAHVDELVERKRESR